MTMLSETDLRALAGDLRRASAPTDAPQVREVMDRLADACDAFVASDGEDPAGLQAAFDRFNSTFEENRSRRLSASVDALDAAVQAAGRTIFRRIPGAQMDSRSGHLTKHSRARSASGCSIRSTSTCRSRSTGPCGC